MNKETYEVVERIHVYKANSKVGKPAEIIIEGKNGYKMVIKNPDYKWVKNGCRAIDD